MFTVAIGYFLSFEKERLKISKRGSTNAVGNASYSPLILFKMTPYVKQYFLEGQQHPRIPRSFPWARKF